VVDSGQSMWHNRVWLLGARRLAYLGGVGRRGLGSNQRRVVNRVVWRIPWTN